MEEELITEEIIGSELNKINDHVKVNLGDGSVDLNGIFVDARTAEDIWGSNDELIGIENVNAPLEMIMCLVQIILIQLPLVKVMILSMVAKVMMF